MLQCILCGKIIIQNDKPLHYAVCSKCDVMDLTDKQKQTILEKQNTLLIIDIEGD